MMLCIYKQRSFFYNYILGEGNGIGLGLGLGLLGVGSPHGAPHITLIQGHTLVGGAGGLGEGLGSIGLGAGIGGHGHSGYVSTSNCFRV